jgi:hypothetical protein
MNQLGYNIFRNRLTNESESTVPVVAARRPAANPKAPKTSVEIPASAPAKLPSDVQAVVDLQTQFDQTLLRTGIIEANSGTTKAAFAKMNSDVQQLLLDKEVSQLITFAKTDPRYASLKVYIKAFYGDWHALWPKDLELIEGSITPADKSLAQQGIAALKKELFRQLIEFKNMSMTQQRDPRSTNIFATKSPLWSMGN